MPERIHWVDFAKGFVIILMVFLHLTRLEYFSKFIMIFHMPFFFVTAGFLLNLNKWGGAVNYKLFTTKLVKRLLMPYFFAELLWYPIWFVVCHKGGFLKHMWDWCETEPLQAFVMIFIGNGNGNGLLLAQLWFLPALFFTEIIFIKLYNRLNELGAEILALTIVTVSSLGFCFANFLVMLWSVDLALVAQLFMLSGILIRKYNLIDKMNLKACLLPALILIAAFGLNKHVDMNCRTYGNALLFYAGAIAGSLLVMKFSLLMTHGKVFSLISHCGQQSMMILVLHPIIVNILYEIIARYTNFPPEVFTSEPIIIFLATLMGVLIPLFIAERFGKLPVLKYFCA